VFFGLYILLALDYQRFMIFNEAGFL